MLNDDDGDDDLTTLLPSLPKWAIAALIDATNSLAQHF
jgi:hypothetical protein